MKVNGTSHINMVKVLIIVQTVVKELVNIILVTQYMILINHNKKCNHYNHKHQIFHE